MLLSLFKNNRSQSIVLIFIISTILFFPYFYNIGVPDKNIFLGIFLFDFLDEITLFLIDYPIVNILLTSFLLVSQAVLINILFNTVGFIKKSSYLPFLIYIMLYIFFSKNLFLNKEVIINLFILLSLFFNINIYLIKKPYYSVFNASLLMSVASLFYIPFLFLFILIWLSLVNYAIYKWREWVISLFGLAVPYIFILMYFFMTDKIFLLSDNLLIYLRLSLQFKNILHSSYFELFAILFIIFLVLLSFINFILKIDEGLIKVRKYKFLVFWMFFIFIIVNSLYFYSLYSYTTSIIPISFLISYYLISSSNKRFTEILFILMIIFVLLSNFRII